mgnify:CR=1 FL=1
MSGVTIALAAVWAFFVGRRADKLGRNFAGWFLLSFLISPLLSWIVLEMFGESDELKNKKKISKSLIEEKSIENETSEIVNENIPFTESVNKNLVPEKLIEEPQVVNIKSDTVIQEDINDTPDSARVNEPIFEKKKISFFENLQTPQKVIYSISTVAISFVLCFAFAQSLDSELSMKETWFVWVFFIAVQTWLQNKFWSSNTPVTINYKQPQLSRIKNWFLLRKKKLYLSLAILLLLTVVAVSIDPLYRYYEKRKIEKLAEPRKLPNKFAPLIGVIGSSLNTKYSEGDIYLNLSLYIDENRKISEYRLKNLHQFISDKNDEQIEVVEEPEQYQITAGGYRYLEYYPYTKYWQEPKWGTRTRKKIIKRPKFVLDEQSAFVTKYADKILFKNLYNKLVDIGYYTGDYLSFYSSYALDMPRMFTLSFTGAGGFEIKSVSISRFSMTRNIGNNGELVGYSYNGSIENAGYVSADEYSKITDWEIKWND